MTREQLRGYVQTLGQPAFRGDQIFAWVARGAADFSQMTDLPAAFIGTLNERCVLTPFEITNKFVSALDGTTKYLVTLYNKQRVECVAMKYRRGLSLCLSTQAGCNMGCAFCASTVGGKTRDLTAGEIADQFIRLAEDLGERPASIVLMGMGEPLDNYDNLLVFLENISDPHGINLSGRHVTVSTCGLCDRIRDLAARRFALTLSLSLHAPDDARRRQIMPVARRWSVGETVDACAYYEQTTGRRVTFEYTLISGFNDSDADAVLLAKALAPMKNRHVNLINVNPIEGSPFRRADDGRVKAFIDILARSGCNPTLRRSMGSDISGSCGQLRARRPIQ